MSLFVKGRQGTGYFKLKLLESKLFKFDLYLLKYVKGSYVCFHTDPAPKGFEHHRINMVFGRFTGGDFICNGLINKRRLNRFRPDNDKHAVGFVKSGTRYVLSLGWLRKSDD